MLLRLYIYSCASLMLGLSGCVDEPPLKQHEAWVSAGQAAYPTNIMFAAKVDDTSAPITFWYGPKQYFGQNGRAQRWINVLGNVVNAEQVVEAYFELNAGERRPLKLGSDLHRLAMSGDFNVEISWDEVHEGGNQLAVVARYVNGSTAVGKMWLFVDKTNFWPLPYRIDFSRVDTLQRVVQVVDGYWQLVPGGVRSVAPYYDRVFCMGDTLWTSYEAVVSLTINGYTPHEPGPPTYDVTHFGLAMRWRGHQADGRQPSRQWYPLGAQGELLIRNELSESRWRILFDGARPDKPPAYGERRIPLALNRRMFVKSQIQTMSDGRSLYRYKQWFDERPETDEWDVEGIERDDYPSGALCLVPHNSDVTIHTVDVYPLP